MTIDPKIIEKAADAIDVRVHEYRVSSPYWVPYCTCGWQAEEAHDVAAYDRHIATTLLEAVADDLRAAAWDEGFKQGGPMHDVNYDDPDAHRRNPYRAAALEAGQP